MLAPSRRARLALDALLDLAWTGRADPVQSGDITGRLGVPRRHLEPLMQDLARAGVLRSVRGPRGGYALARERRRITVGDILRAAEGCEAATPAALAGSDLARHVTAPFWTEAAAEAMARLDAVTLEDLCARAMDAGLSPPDAAQPDFAI